jgi:hypothetical protein
MKRRPIIIVGSGYDGSQEVLYNQMGKAALDRGWNVITYKRPARRLCVRSRISASSLSGRKLLLL